VLAGGTFLATLMLVFHLAVPAEAAPGLNVAPQSGLPGRSVQVSGTGFLPLVSVNLCWGDTGCSNHPVGATGRFDTKSVIPASTAPGSIQVSACQTIPLEGLTCASAPVQVLGEETPASSTTTSSIASTTTSSIAPTTTTTLPPSTASGPTTSSPQPTTPESTAARGPTAAPGPTSTSQPPATIATTTTSPGVAVGSPTTSDSTDQADGSDSPDIAGLEISGATPPDDSAPEADEPATVSTSPNSQGRHELSGEEDNGASVEAAAPEPETAFPGPPGLSLRSPVVFWTVWFLVVSTTVVVVATASSVFETRRRTHR